MFFESWIGLSRLMKQCFINYCNKILAWCQSFSLFETKLGVILLTQK